MIEVRLVIKTNSIKEARERLQHASTLIDESNVITKDYDNSLLESANGIISMSTNYKPGEWKPSLGNYEGTTTIVDLDDAKNAMERG